MKKITFLVAVLMLIGSMSFGQKSSLRLTQVSVNSTVNSISQKVSTSSCDTLMPPKAGTPCGDSLVFYNAGNNQGYLTGNDQYGDQAAAQVYKNTTSAKISTVLVGEVAVKSPTPTATTVVNIYSINATTNAPTTLLGTSNTVALSAISTTGLTAYTFTTPVTVTGAFAVSVAFPTTAGDTLAVFSNPIDCYTSDSLSWELQSTGTWYSYAGSYGQNSWGDNLELAIYPILCASTGIEDYFVNGIKLNQNQPNPATTTTLIQYEVQNNSNVSLQVFDITGRLVLTMEEGNQMTGKHTIVIDAGKLQSGTYFYSLKAGDNRLTKKMVIE